jgi:hypothetical protein
VLHGGGKKAFEGASQLGGMGVDASMKLKSHIQDSNLYKVVMIVAPLLLYILLGLVLGEIEGWDFVTSIYVACISLATVGYGDFSPQSQGGRLFMSFYIPTGVAVTLNIIARVTIFIVNMKAKHSKEEQLKLMMLMDTGGDSMVGEVSNIGFTHFIRTARKSLILINLPLICARQISLIAFLPQLARAQTWHSSHPSPPDPPLYL